MHKYEPCNAAPWPCPGTLGMLEREAAVQLHKLVIYDGGLGGGYDCRDGAIANPGMRRSGLAHETLKKPKRPHSIEKLRWHARGKRRRRRFGERPSIRAQKDPRSLASLDRSVICAWKSSLRHQFVTFSTDAIRTYISLARGLWHQTRNRIKHIGLSTPGTSKAGSSLPLSTLMLPCATGAETSGAASREECMQLENGATEICA